MTPLPPALPHCLSCLTCPVSGLVLLPPSLVVSGSNGDTVRCSTRPGRNADIPPLRLVRILTTMPLFLAVIRGKWAICRAGQGSAKRPRFTPKTRPKQQKPRWGFQFSETGRRSVPAVSVPPARAAHRPRQGQRERRGGDFFSENPVGVFIFPAPGKGPGRGAQRATRRQPFARLPNAGQGSFLPQPCGAWPA